MTKRKTNKDFITNDELVPEVLRAKKLGRITPELGRMILLLVDHYAQHRWWCGYSDNWLSEMKSEAVVALTKALLKFNPQYAIDKGKKPNVFAFSTTCMYRAFKSVRDKEKRHTDLEDILPDGLY